MRNIRAESSAKGEAAANSISCVLMPKRGRHGRGARGGGAACGRGVSACWLEAGLGLPYPSGPRQWQSRGVRLPLMDIRRRTPCHFGTFTPETPSAVLDTARARAAARTTLSPDVDRIRFLPADAPHRGDGAGTKAARAVCGRCAVVEDCRAWALGCGTQLGGHDRTGPPSRPSPYRQASRAA